MPLAGREQGSHETELSAILLSFIECEVEQEQCAAASSPAQREADEELKRERDRRREKEVEQKRTLSLSVMCTDVATALGQTLPVFCVHLRLVSPVLL